MQTEDNHLVFVEVPNPGKKTKRFDCRNKNSKTKLGTVKWYGHWRQYCFFTELFIEAVYSDGCLKDISHFINQLKIQEGR